MSISWQWLKLCQETLSLFIMMEGARAPALSSIDDVGIRVNTEIPNSPYSRDYIIHHLRHFPIPSMPNLVTRTMSDLSTTSFSHLL